MSDFSGIYPILYAFYDKAGRLDDGLMRLQVDKCIGAGAHGIAVVGLVTEVHKLDVNERRHLVEVVGRAIDGRVPYAVTVGESSVYGQVEFARMAQANGASWVILQPPSIKGYAEAEYVRFLGAVADQLEIPVAVQNNPVNMDVSLSNSSLLRLREEHSNSVPNLLCYGKRLFAQRIGITEISSRSPEWVPIEFGLPEVRRMTRGWGNL
jgi:2-keto-3-deoxy-L-arabinonate dehydratase